MLNNATTTTNKTIMCNFISVVYLSLFIVNIVKSYDIKGETYFEKNNVISNLHYRISRSIDKNRNIEDTTISDGGTESTESIATTEESQDTVNDLEIFTEASHEFFQSIKESKSINKTGNNVINTGNAKTPRHIFKGSFKRKYTYEDGESYDYSDTYDYETENNNKETDENVVDENKHSSESGEILIYTPNSKTLSQDIVLDLKARNGHISLKEIDFDDDLKQSNENDPEKRKDATFDPFLRSGYVPQDHKDVETPSLNENVNNNFNEKSNLAYNSGLNSQFNRPHNTRPDTTADSLLNYLPMFSPLFLNNINSKELLNTNTNSREYVWEEQNNAAGQLRNTVKSPYFGLTQPSNQLYYQKNNERCSTCFPSRYLSQERHFKRSSQEDYNKIKTAHGGPIDFDLLESNAYPLSPNKEIEDVQRLQGISDNLMAHQRQQGFASQELTHSTRNVQQPGIQTPSELFPKVPDIFPPFVQRNKPILFTRRIGLGGLHKIVLNK